MLIRTSRWPFLPFAIIFAAPGLFFPSLTVIAVMRGWEFLRSGPFWSSPLLSLPYG
jgi:hypothetical protein